MVDCSPRRLIIACEGYYSKFSDYTNLRSVTFDSDLQKCYVI
jgi:hypothetical protein